jgi:DNA-binding CsgD family transcriptional regulator
MTNIDRHYEDDQQATTLAQERAVVKEWLYLQQALLHFASTAFQRQSSSWRAVFEGFITQITANRARIWWRSASTNTAANNSQFVEIRYRQYRYGTLELAAGYLVSSILPGIPQLFADLCALLLYTAEHERFVQYQLAQLPPTVSNIRQIALTPREKNVLQGLIYGESEHDMAQRLGLAPTTVHAHVQRLYNRLDVHSAQEAIVRAFELRLVDWVDMPEKG